MMLTLILSTLSTLALLISPLSLSAQNSFSVSLDVNGAAEDQDVTPDFNRDGVVNFADFLEFVGQFGTRQGDGRYKAKYDLDSDGAISFGDFLIFSSRFGKEISTPDSGGSTTTVIIPDANLRVAIETALGKARGAPITQAEMASLTRLDAPNTNISDLTGLAFATKLTRLSLGENQILDVSALSGLNNLKSLQLGYNLISDISPLSNLNSLEHLNLNANVIPDISALSSLNNLKWLWFSDNAISDVSPLSGLTLLEYLNLSTNLISDISALSSMINLTDLYLSNNSISNITPLVANTGLGSGDEVDVRNNPLSDTSLNTHIPALQGRGVNVLFGASKPAVAEIEQGMIPEDWEASTPPLKPGSRLKITPR